LYGSLTHIWELHHLKMVTYLNKMVSMHSHFTVSGVPGNTNWLGYNINQTEMVLRTAMMMRL
jgi:hypothetical protein